MKTKITLLLFLIYAGAKSQTFQWAESFSGSGTERSNAVVTDASGNVYTAGILMGTADFDPGPGTYTLSAGGGGAFISKIDANGNFVWAKCLIAGGGCYINALALDPSGNVITTGGFQNTIDLDPGAGADYQTAAGSHDVFVSKLNNSGNYVWGRIFGGTGIEWGDGITVDASGDIYVTGNFNSNNMDFDPSATTYSAASAGGPDAFISKLSSAGNFMFAKTLGGTGSDYGKGIKVDASKNIYTTGYYANTGDFDPSSSTFTITSAGSSDLFVSKLDATGNFVWAKSMGGASSDYAYAIEIDPTGNVLTTGAFQGTGDYDPGPGTYSLTFSGVYVSKLDNSGNFMWADKLGGSSGYAITTDAVGNVYTTGYYYMSGDFDPGTGVVTLNPVAGSNDVFVSELDPSGNYIWAGTMGGVGTDNGFGICVNGSDVYVTGYYNAAGDFDITSGSYSLTPVGGYDAFVTKFSAAPTGIKEKDHENTGLTIYPNPSNGKFTVKLDDKISEAQLVVVDVLGKEILKQNLSEIRTIEINLEIKGLYFVRLDSKEKQEVKKIVVQ